MKLTKNWIIASVTGLAVSSFGVMAHNHGDHNASNLKALVKQAQSAEGRPERRCRTRPQSQAGEDALEFFGLEPDMKVIELIPGAVGIREF